MTAGRRLPYSEGVGSQSPGSRSAPWVSTDKSEYTPKALRHGFVARLRCNAFRRKRMHCDTTQGALRDPGL